MICGIGVDQVDVARIRNMRLRWGDRFLKRVFTDSELENCLASAHRDQRLAARFAAKEAFLKAIGTGFALGANWLDIEVRSDSLGAPALLISGSAAELMRSRNADKSHLSLTHTAQTAVAVVVLER